MFAALGRFAYKRRRLIIVIWIALFGFGIAFAPRLSSALNVGGFSEERTEAVEAGELLHLELGWSPSQLAIVFNSRDLTVDDPAYRAEVTAALDNLGRLPYVEAIIGYLTSPDPHYVSGDRHATYAVLDLSVNPNNVLPELRRALPEGEVTRFLTGSAPVYWDIERVSEQDLRKAEMVSLPLALAALLLVFGSLAAAGMPVIVGAVSVGLTLAVIYFLAQVMQMSIFVMNMASMLGLGIAIDYSLFIVSRFREELAGGQGVESAVERALATAGRSIFFSGLTVFIGLAGLLIFESPMLRSLGMGGVVVVIISVVAALTLLPAVLAVLGPRINALRILHIRRGDGHFWHNLALWVMRKPLLVFLPVLVLLLLLGVPFLRVNLGEPDATILPKRMASRQGFDLLKEKFGPGEIFPILIAVQTQGSVFEPQNVSALYDFTHAIAQDERVSRVVSIVDLMPGIGKEQYQALYARPDQVAAIPELKQLLPKLTNGRTSMIEVITRHAPTSEESKALARTIRDMRPVDGLSVSVGGLAAGTTDAVNALYKDFPPVIIFVVIVTYLVLMLLFRSVVLPLKAVLMNTLSILASYGALVFIFQEGHFARLFNFSAPDHVEATVPIIMFGILFGLSMDYEVFLLSRIKEIYDQTGDNTRSVALGLERTGRLITSAALILVLVAASFALGDLIIIKSLGIGLALAIFIDATVVRALLVPATMRLLGNLNWWAPGFLRRTVLRQEWRM